MNASISATLLYHAQGRYIYIYIFLLYININHKTSDNRPIHTTKGAGMSLSS